MRALEQELTFNALAEVLRQSPPLQIATRLWLCHGTWHPRGVVLELRWRRVADALVQMCNAILMRQPTCSLALSGGKTPETLYRLLSTRRYREALDWSRVYLFWGDERYVPHDDPRSNYQMAYRAWLRKAGIPAANIHPMPTHYPDPDAAARAYEAELRAYFGDTKPFPRFDLVLLGLGEDGHIASLFAGDPALGEQTRWVVPSCAPTEPSQRLTLTLPVLNHAQRIWFLVAGESKRAVIARLFQGPPDPTLPATQLSPIGECFWWLSKELRKMLTLLQP
ncbi:MAG: 6-phosphogluconolactonase [Fimbriimonadales bacterium]|nr:6-phosphogluconolactonase [Fimbriimonadales bacterium]MDW8051269.1 6-phosphogluconolactonase [Armatimonadota bacterium]